MSKHRKGFKKPCFEIFAGAPQVGTVKIDGTFKKLGRTFSKEVLIFSKTLSAVPNS